MNGAQMMCARSNSPLYQVVLSLDGGRRKNINIIYRGGKENRKLNSPIETVQQRRVRGCTGSWLHPNCLTAGPEATPSTSNTCILLCLLFLSLPVPLLFPPQEDMHTFLNRANAVFAYAFSCVATVTLCCYLSTAWVTPMPDIALELNQIRVRFPFSFVLHYQM